MAASQKTDKVIKNGDAEVANISTSGQAYFSAADAKTALAGGAQAGTAITTGIVRFTTVATVGDSAQLPTAEAGLEITVINSGAQNMNVFPKTGETINALAANAALAIVAGKTAVFVCPVAGKWFAVVSA